MVVFAEKCLQVRMIALLLEYSFKDLANLANSLPTGVWVALYLCEIHVCFQKMPIVKTYL